MSGRGSQNAPSRVLRRMTEPRDEPPQAPEIPPRLRFPKLEIVGVGIMALLPLAAITGAFGPATAREAARAGSLTIEAEYPARIRNAMTERITVDLSNEADRKSTRLNSSHVRISYAVF